MRGGYAGRGLEVDLTNNKVNFTTLKEADALNFIGGKGLGAKLLFDHLPARTDPLSPENILIFLTGPLTGTLTPTSARWCVVTKSPLTGIFLDSQVGGQFGAKMKFANFDYFTIKGKAKSPVYLYVNNDGGKLLPAENLWGLGIHQTEAQLKEKYPHASVAAIGPAGEKLVKIACITADTYRQAGRGGAGAVMGSKNLKAIVVEGDSKPELADKDGFLKLAKELGQMVLNHPFMAVRRSLGTPLWVRKSNDGGFLPTRNFSSGYFEKAEDISAETMKERIVQRNHACFNCTIACGKFSRVTGGKYDGTVVEGPEYETLALMGSNCGINSLEAIAKANQLCDDLGLDTISTGNVIAFAMECNEKGLLSKTNGLDLKFGNEDAMVEMVKKIAYREGLGDLLAEGVKRAAESIGQGSDVFAIHVKGMELPGYEPRGTWGMALAYATADRGGCHQRAFTPGAELDGALPRFSTEKLAGFVKSVQDERSSCFSLVVCDFVPLSVEDCVNLLNLATGFSMTTTEYLIAGERIWNLARVFNLNSGITRQDDCLPLRFHQEKLPSGAAKGQAIPIEDFNKMIDEYYQMRGWDVEGIPTNEKLSSLGLSKIS
jgi:aldehyde:ferredoxin oxidoreductase